MFGTISEEPASWVVDVNVLAWGVSRMLRILFADEAEADAADATAAKLLGTA
jgi:hypothetical protein